MPITAKKLNYADNGHNTRRGQNVPDIPKMEKNGPKMDQKRNASKITKNGLRALESHISVLLTGGEDSSGTKRAKMPFILCN